MQSFTKYYHHLYSIGGCKLVHWTNSLMFPNLSSQQEVTIEVRKVFSVVDFACDLIIFVMDNYLREYI